MTLQQSLPRLPHSYPQAERVELTGGELAWNRPETVGSKAGWGRAAYIAVELSEGIRRRLTQPQEASLIDRVSGELAACKAWRKGQAVPAFSSRPIW